MSSSYGSEIVEYFVSGLVSFAVGVFAVGFGLGMLAAHVVSALIHHLHVSWR